MHRSLLCILAALLLCSVSLQVNAQTAGGASYDLGVFAYEEGNFREAEAHFNKALEAAPEDPSTNHYLGKALMAQERYDEAQKHFNAAWEKDPALPGLAYDRAYGFYKMGEYGKGADLFIEVVQLEPDHILANFYGGVCLYKNRRYQEANPYLMSAAEKSPELKVKGYYFSGLCHYYMGQEEQASQKLTFVQANSTSSDVKRNAEKWLKRIREGKKAAKPYELEFKVAFAYDDNAPLEPKDQEVFSDEKDTVLLGYVSGRYHVNTKPSMELGLGISRAQSWYTKLDELNSSETALQFYGYYHTDPFSYGISFRPVLYQVDAEDFLLTYQAIPQMTYRFSKALAARAFYTYSANDYRQGAYDDRDGSTHEGFLDTIYSLNGDRGYLLGGIGYEANTASEDIYDYGRLNIKFAMEYHMAWGLTLKMIGKFSNKSYKNENPFENKKRRDHRYEGSVSLARKLNYNWLQIALEHNFMKNDSNMSDYEYTRQVTGVVLIADF